MELCSQWVAIFIQIKAIQMRSSDLSDMYSSIIEVDKLVKDFAPKLRVVAMVVDDKSGEIVADSLELALPILRNKVSLDLQCVVTGKIYYCVFDSYSKIAKKSRLNMKLRQSILMHDIY